MATIISGAFLDWLAPSVGFLLFAAAWSFMRRKFIAFVLPVGVMIALYAFVHGAAHHHGTAFVAAIAGLWIAWPTPGESQVFTVREHRAANVMIALLLCLSGINIWDAAVVVQRERVYPYSGAEDAAKYLKSVGADRGQIFGFLIGVAAVQAYFDHNILANIPTTYFHHGLPLAGTNLDVDDLRRVKPEYVIAYSQEPEIMMKYGLQQLTAEGYEMVHFSDGYYLYKRGVHEREVYFILRRNHPPFEQFSLPSPGDLSH